MPSRRFEVRHEDRERLYLVTYAGQMTAEDRAALQRPGFAPSAHGFEVSSPNLHGGWSMTAYQAVRVTAASAEDARQQVIEAMGREPADLRAMPGQG
jgi:hypothetical protein